LLNCPEKAATDDDRALFSDFPVRPHRFPSNQWAIEDLGKNDMSRIVCSGELRKVQSRVSRSFGSARLMLSAPPVDELDEGGDS